MVGSLGENRGDHTKLAVLLLAIILLVPVQGFAAASDFFLPTIYSTAGDLEVAMSYRSDQNEAGGKTFRTSDANAVEKMRLTMNGFFYHPRFIQFLLKGSAGLSQEEVRTSYTQPYRVTDSAPEYEARIKILPEHPYNLEAYSWSITPIGLGRFSAETRPVSSENGVIFNYALKPLFLNLLYNENTVDSKLSRSDSRTRRASGSYLVGPMNNVAVYTHTDTSTSEFLYTTREEAYFDNTITFSNVSLFSEVKDIRLQQYSPFTDDLRTDSFLWLEQFSANLPWNFSTSLSYHDQRDKLQTMESVSGLETETINETVTKGATLSWKLYDSVRAHYNYHTGDVTTTRGETHTVMNAVNGTYTKRIPRGRMTASVLGSRVDMTRDNAPAIVGENHNAPLFGSFYLTRENIDVPTVTVRVIADSGALIDLVENVHYIMNSYGITVEITIISLPPSVTFGHPFGFIYTFYVNYSLLSSTVELRTDTYGYNLSLALFDNLVNPYYNHLSMDQTVLSGSVPGGPQDSDTDIMGIIIQKLPFLFLSEYREVRSTFYPSRTIRDALEYQNMVNDTTSLAMKGQYTQTHYGAGTTFGRAYSEHIESLDMKIQKSAPQQNLTASLGGSYSKRHSGITTELLSATAAVMWHNGQLTVSAGASLYDSSSTTSLGTQTMLSQYYYLTVTRKLW